MIDLGFTIVSLNKNSKLENLVEISTEDELVLINPIKTKREMLEDKDIIFRVKTVQRENHCITNCFAMFFRFW